MKSLAGQTAATTERINGQIEAIRERTSVSVGAISDVSDAIREIQDLAESMAMAAGEQSAATAEIAERVTDASRRTREIGSGIDAVAGSTRTTEDLAGALVATADRLEVGSRSLRENFDRFLKQVRAA